MAVMNSERIQEIEARVADQLRFWNEPDITPLLVKDIPDLIASLRESWATIAKLKGRPWGYGPTDAEGNYPDELQYYEPNEELEMAADVAAYDAAKARNEQATPWADINWAEI